MSMPVLALLAGGLATRLGPLSSSTPKSLVNVAGRPFIHHQLTWLAAAGITDLVVCAGHLGEKIRDFSGDGSRYGLRLHYSFDGEKLLGTGGALKKALPLLSDPFFTLYGDSYLDLPLDEVLSAFKASGKPGLMSVWRNEGQLGPSNVDFENGLVRSYEKQKPDPNMRYIDYGLGLLSKAAFEGEAREAFDLSELFSSLASGNGLAGYESLQRFYEIGSVEGLKETERLIQSRA